MIYLIGSIILSSYLTLSFKVVERLGLNNFQVIVFNYITCVITGSFVNGHFPINTETVSQPWFTWACIMGATFIILFNIIGFTTQRLGVAVASVANKLSLVIPFIFSIILYNEKATALKIAGVVMALVSVLFTCWPSKQQQSTHSKKISLWISLVPAILFLGSGLLDTMIKYVEQGFINENNNNEYLITAFAAAGTIGLLVLISAFITGKQQFSSIALLMGIAIGIPNYFSIWCLMQVLKDYSSNSSAIIPINNMGIVLFSTLVAGWIFKERLSKLNWTGVLLAIAAIALIAYG